jgi:hypothetical protein
MPRWASKIIIGPQDFSGCRGLIIGGHEFDSGNRGSIDWAASGTPYVQIITVGAVGLPFGVSMENIEASKIETALAAIRTAEGTGSTIEVWLTDALNDIHVRAYPDYRVPWFTHGPESEGMIADVMFHFISMALFS